jgi:tetratricopeptide (TPR) repeat protein
VPADAPAIPTSTAADGPAAAGQIRAVETGASLPLPERAERIERAMARATDATAREDHAAAILAYNEVLALDPNHQEARAKLLEAGEAYREQRAVLDQIEKARVAFEEGEYSTALRFYYRLPAGSVDAETVDRYKFNGWFNLAVAALQAGDTRQAIANLDEALALRGTEADARRLREFAASYEAQTKDRRYYAEVGSLTFRALED